MTCRRSGPSHWRVARYFRLDRSERSLLPVRASSGWDECGKPILSSQRIPHKFKSFTMFLLLFVGLAPILIFFRASMGEIGFYYSLIMALNGFACPERNTQNRNRAISCCRFSTFRCEYTTVSMTDLFWESDEAMKPTVVIRRLHSLTR